MPYCRKTDQFVLCPPKNGTHTVHYVMQTLWQSCEHDGHVRYSEAVKRLQGEQKDPAGVRWAMTVRNPLTRAYSAVNHYLYCNQSRTLDEAIEVGIESERALFQPQKWFLEGGEGRVRLFAFDAMPILHWLDWPEHRKVPHKNPGKPMASRKDITDHKRFNELMARYDEDWPLFEAVTGV